MRGHFSPLVYGLAVTCSFGAPACGAGDDAEAPSTAGTGGLPAVGGTGTGGVNVPSTGGVLASGGSGAGTGGVIASGGSSGGVVGDAGAAGTGSSLAGATSTGGAPSEPCVPSGPALVDAPATLIAEAAGTELRSFTLAASGLYYNDDAGPIYRVVPGEGGPEVVAQDAFAGTMVAGGGYLYYVGVPGALYRVPLDTLPAAPEQVVLQVAERPLAFDGASIYFTFTGAPSGLFSFPATELDPAPMPVLADVTPGAMAVHDGYVYYVNNVTLERAPLGGGSAEVVTSAGALGEFAVGDDGWVYYVVADELMAQAIDEPGTGVPIARGNLSYPGSEARAFLRRVTVTDEHVYYREDTGALAWVAKDGSACGIVAKVPTEAPAYELDYFMDATRLYVLEHNQRIWALPRP